MPSYKHQTMILAISLTFQCFILAALEARDTKALSEFIVGLRLLVEDLEEETTQSQKNF